ncbi:MAG: hypothetical protein ACREJ2_07520 [Planctomycetota bacterium]
MEGVENPQDLQAFGLSRRLLTRLHALMAEQIQCTPVLLEMAAENGNHAKLLLDMSILKNPAGLDLARLNELQGIYLTADDAVLTLVKQNDVRVLGLEEEVLAEQVMQAHGLAPVGDLRPTSPRAERRELAGSSGRQRPTEAQRAGGDGGTGDRDGSTLALLGAGAGRGPRSAGGGGGGEDMFSEPMLQHLKLKLLTAADEGARAEALRILGLAPIAPHEKTELCLKALADGSQLVRSEAARLLRDQGFKTDLANALAGISAAEAEQRSYHLTRLGRMLEGASEVETTGATICLLRRVDEEPQAELLREVLVCIAQVLTGRSVGRGTVAEVLRAALAVFSRHGNAIVGGVRQVFQALRVQAASEVAERLWVEIERNSNPVVRAECLSQLAELLKLQRAGGEASEAVRAAGDRLARACVHFLDQDEESGYAAHSVGSVLMEMPEEAVRELVQGVKAAKSAQIVYMLRLLDYIVRFRTVAAEGKQAAARALLQVLTHGDQQVRTAAMETTLATDPELERSLRVELAEAFLEHLKDLMFEADKESAQATIARMGAPAVEVLLRHLDPLVPAKQRITAVHNLGEAVRQLQAPADREGRKEYKEIVETVLRQLKLLSLEKDFPDPGEVDLCLGKVAACQGLSRESIQVCARHLLMRADETLAMLERARAGQFATEPLAWRSAALSLEGLSWLCTSRNISQQVLNESFERLRAVLAGPPVDSDHPDVQHRDSEGETLFEVGPSVEILVEVVPAAVEGVTRLALAPAGHAKVGREAAEILKQVWRQANRGEILLSPGNSITLVESLRDLGSSTRVPATVAVEILKTLAQRKEDPQILMHMALLAAASPYRELAAYAVRVGMEICKHRDQNGNFDPEVREFYLNGLAAAISRGDLPAEAAPVVGLRREALQCLYDGLADGIPRCLENLTRLRDKKVLRKIEQSDLETRLKSTPVPFVREETYRW